MDLKEITDFIIKLKFNKIPPNVLLKSKRCILDTLGAALAGSCVPASIITRNFVKEMGGGVSESTLLGFGEKVSCLNAALINTTAANALDIEDGHLAANGHPGSIITSVALAITEREKLSGQNFIEAVIVGYEVYLKIAIHAHSLSRELYNLIAVGTGTLGVFGAAATAGKLLGLNKKELTNALGVAGSFAPIAPNLRALETGAMTQESLGWTAAASVAATFLAKAGFTGPDTILKDIKGPKDLGLGKDYEILNVYFKPYASCRWSHPAIDCVLKIIQAHRFSPEDITEIEIQTVSWAKTLDNPPPKNCAAAQYNLPYVIGAAITDGKVGPDQIAENRLKDPIILSIAKKVKILVSPEIDVKYPERCGALVKIKTKKQEYETHVAVAKGDPKNPLTDYELETKFKELTERVLPKEKMNRVIQYVNNLEDLNNLDNLIKNLY